MYRFVIILSLKRTILWQIETYGHFEVLCLSSLGKLASDFTRFPPAWEITIHQGMEVCVMAGFLQVAEFVYHHMFNTPFRQ